MKRIISILLSVILAFSCLSMNTSAYFSFFEAEESRGISLLANYCKQSAGRAGTIYVNEFNRELLIERIDFTTMCNTVPFNITWFYSSYDNGYSKEDTYGYHWKTNFDVRLSFDVSTQQFIYLHNDGAKVYFNETLNQNNGYTYWGEVPSIMCRLDKLYVKNHSTSTDGAYIITYDGQKLVFDSHGRLSHINTKDSITEINYNEIGIDNVIDPCGRTFMFSYNDNGAVSNIKAYDINNEPIVLNAGKKTTPYIIKYSYEHGNLSKVIYPDGNTINYNYSQKGSLTEVDGLNQHNYAVSYKKDQVTYLGQKCSESDSNRIIAKYQRSDSQIIKTTAHGKKVYTYNDYGLLVSDNSYIKRLSGEMALMEDESETATKERVSSCNCTNCHIVNCNCTCDNYIECVCLQCKLSDLTTSCTLEIESSNSKNKENCLYYKDALGYISSQYDNANNEIYYNYDFNQNLISTTIKINDLSNSIFRNDYEYEQDNVVSIKSQSTQYNLNYDEWGNPSGYKIGTVDNVCFDYVDGNINYVEKKSYGNGQSIQYSYLNNGKISKIRVNDHLAFSYEYLPNDEIKIYNELLSTVVSIVDNTYTISDLDNNRLFSIENSFGRKYTLILGNDKYDVKWQYVKTNDHCSFQSVTQGEKTSTTVDIISDYTVNNISAIISDNDSNTIGYSFSRNPKSVTKEQILKTHIKSSDGKSEKTWIGAFDSDKLINVSLNGDVYSTYTYDGIGELLSAKNINLNYSEEFTYNNSGNILTHTVNSRGEAIKSNTYEYSDQVWGDKLTAYNGQKIEYDEIGNPISFGNTCYSWSGGRELSAIQKDDYYIKLTYDDSGLRQGKTVYDIKSHTPMYKYDYYWCNGIMLAFDVHDYNTCTTNKVAFILDTDGNSYGYIVDDRDIYIYEKNSLNEIIGIYRNGTQVGEYAYSAFGEIVSSTEDECLSKLNILLYKSYIFDKETDMYYLKSRYYDPQWGRFLNADIYIDTGTGVLGTNMFAYCENDPINYIDPDGF